MTATLFQDHADAVLTLLRDEHRLTVYPSAAGGPLTVPDRTQPPYLTVRFNAERTSGGRLDNRSTRFMLRVYLYCVGGDDEAARAVCDLAAGAILDVKPNINGRACFPIRHEHHRPLPPEGDESTGRLVATILDMYRLESLPGSTGS